MITDVNRDKPAPLKKEWDMLKVSIATMRILIGVLFLLSGIANYIYLNAEGGLVQTLMQSKLLLWG